MITQINRAREGIRKPGALVSIVLAGAATAIDIYLLTAGRTCEIRKIFITNRNAAPSNIQIGTGLAGAFVQGLPSVYTVAAGQDLEISEEMIPAIEFTANVTAQASAAAAAPNDVQIRLEVEEYMGPTG